MEFAGLKKLSLHTFLSDILVCNNTVSQFKNPTIFSDLLPAPRQRYTFRKITGRLIEMEKPLDQIFFSLIGPHVSAKGFPFK